MINPGPIGDENSVEILRHQLDEVRRECRWLWQENTRLRGMSFWSLPCGQRFLNRLSNIFLVRDALFAGLFSDFKKQFRGKA